MRINSGNKLLAEFEGAGEPAKKGDTVVYKAPPKLRGDALMVIKTESASALIYWNGKRYAWYQQGD